MLVSVGGAGRADLRGVVRRGNARGHRQAGALQRERGPARLSVRSGRDGRRPARFGAGHAVQDPLQLRSFHARWGAVHGHASVGAADRPAVVFAVALVERSGALFSGERAAGVRHGHRRGGVVGHADPQGGVPLFAYRRGARFALCVELPARPLHHLRSGKASGTGPGPHRLDQRPTALPGRQAPGVDDR